MNKSKGIQLHNLYPTSNKYEYVAKALLATVDINMQNFHEWAILDSFATSHFLVIALPTSDLQDAKNPLSVKLPDGARVNSTHMCTLSIPELPSKARIAHIIPGLTAYSLLSIVQLCNAGCEVIITKIACTVHYKGRLILQGKKFSRTKLWMVPFYARPITLNTGPSITPPTQPLMIAHTMRDHLKGANGEQEIEANIIPTSNKEE